MNGSGKTTFVKLMCRLYAPTEGQILLKGIDISKYNYDEYVKLFSVAFQDYFTFAFFLGENVSAQQNYNAKKVQSYLQKVGVWDKFSNTERGLETPQRWTRLPRRKCFPNSMILLGIRRISLRMWNSSSSVIHSVSLQPRR
jgi:ABC-type siderophore export system fused ATPase/permease subunit